MSHCEIVQKIVRNYSITIFRMDGNGPHIIVCMCSMKCAQFAPYLEKLSFLNFIFRYVTFCRLNSKWIITLDIIKFGKGGGGAP